MSRRPARRRSWTASVLPADPVDRRVLGAVAAARLVAMPAASLAIVAGTRAGRGSRSLRIDSGLRRSAADHSLRFS